MIDHLAQLDAHLTGMTAKPDRWHGSRVTTASDLAPFGAVDLDEARSRLERLAQLWQSRLRDVPSGAMDAAEGDDYTPREMAYCAIGSAYYADAVGRLETYVAPRARRHSVGAKSARRAR
jgi:hypothetical protein